MFKMWVIAIVFMVICAVTDIRKKEIPIVLVILFGVLAAVYIGLFDKQEISSILYSFIPGAFLLALSLCTKESIGYGDGLVVLVLGLMTGCQKCIFIVSIGLLAASICALALLVLRKVNGRSRLPFVPFLAIGLGVMLIVQTI